MVLRPSRLPRRARLAPLGSLVLVASLLGSAGPVGAFDPTPAPSSSIPPTPAGPQGPANPHDRDRQGAAASSLTPVFCSGGAPAAIPVQSNTQLKAVVISQHAGVPSNFWLEASSDL